MRGVGCACGSADRIAARLTQKGHTVGVLHSDRSQRERIEALSDEEAEHEDEVGALYHVRYAVAATVHVAGLALTGTFHNLEVLSNDTVIGGQTYASGYYSFAFVVGSQTYGPVTGTTAPLPESAGLGIALSRC